MPILQRRLEALTQKRWFYLVLLALFFLPSYSSLAYDPRRTSDLITAVLSHPLIYAIPSPMPVFKILPALLVLGLVIWGDRITRLFDAYVAMTILLLAFLQNMAMTQEFGFAAIVGNVVVYSFVAFVWSVDAILKVNVLTFRRLPLWRYWVVPVALLAFWFPVNTETMVPDFSASQLLTNSAGLALCMMLPTYLAVLALCYPTINRPVMQITAFAGVVTAGFNILQWFWLTSYTWLGILHLPLLTISLYSLILSLKQESACVSGHDQSRA